MSDPKLSYTFDDWCRGHDLSKTAGYALLAKGEGPETFTVGSRRHVSFEADALWIKQREQASKLESVRPVARLEKGKATANAKRKAQHA
ncbi:MAG TPA: hypothetical protein VIE65_14250 [Methylobacter sp.]|jgi:hypothetical protein